MTISVSFSTIGRSLNINLDELRELLRKKAFSEKNLTTSFDFIKNKALKQFGNELMNYHRNWL